MDVFIDGLNHVDGNADRACLIGDCTRNRLPNPPRRIGTELITLTVVEFLNRLQETEVALLNEIEKEHAASDVAFCNAHDKAQVRLLKPMPCTLVARLHAPRELDLLLCRQQRNTTDLFEVHADGIIKRNSLGHAEVDLNLRLVLIQFIDGFENVIIAALVNHRIVNNLNVVIAEPLIEPIHCVGGHCPLDKRLDEFSTGQCAAVCLSLCYKLIQISHSAHIFPFHAYCCRLHDTPSFQFVVLSNKKYHLTYRCECINTKVLPKIFPEITCADFHGRSRLEFSSLRLIRQCIPLFLLASVPPHGVCVEPIRP